MSARHRGIIVSADPDDGKLIIEASDRDVAAFGRGALVEVTQLQAPPERPAMHWYGQQIYSSGLGGAWPGQGPHVHFDDIGQGNVLLVTRCGCKRRVQIDHPQPTIQLPIVASTSLYILPGEPQPVSFGARRFRFKREHRHAHPWGYSDDYPTESVTYEYEEEP